MTAIRTFIESLLQFAGDSLRPMRRAGGIAQELGISFLGVAGVLWVLRTHGGLWAAVTVLAVLTLIFLIQGGRREYRQRRVKFSVTPNPGEWFGESDHDPNGFMQYAVLIENNGAGGHFNAAVASEVKGAMKPGYGHFECAWEGTAEVEPPIRTDRARHVLVGLYVPATKGFRFIVPPSPRTGGIEYGYGPDQLFKTDNWQIEFELDVRHVETGEHERRKVQVRFDRVGAHCPVMKFV
jgi:hypothetical protein